MSVIPEGFASATLEETVDRYNEGEDVILALGPEEGVIFIATTFNKHRGDTLDGYEVMDLIAFQYFVQNKE